MTLYKKVVLKLTGHIFSEDLLQKNLSEYSRLIRRLKEERLFQKLVIVAGGGELARFYISLGRKIGLDESSLDELGIMVSRIHAKLLGGALMPHSCPRVPTSLDELATALNEYPIVVMGGLQPGHSTSAVAALVAERIGSDLLLVATDVEGVYTQDPKIDKDARLLSSVSIRQLYELLMSAQGAAGTYELLDFVALKIIERSRIHTRIAKCEPSVISDILRGIDRGTIIKMS